MAAKAKKSAGQPERPIQSIDEDLLERKGFVARLADSLISPATGKATGVVVGVTGPWGSGKSSILNMLAEAVEEKYETAHVVRFDPWLVSGRNDLVSEFISELLTTFDPDDQRQKAIIGTLTKYGNILAPIANFWNPLAGAATAGGLKAVGELFGREQSLSSLRKTLMQQLAKLDSPVVVLIDELDRVEDSEIRTVAQLVRSVADFPGISYVIAYDVNRVIQALGAGVAERERAERGRSYLEKIVQFAFPLPIMFTEELERLLVAELTALTKTVSLPPKFDQSERFKEAIALLFRHTLSTPRDIKRLTGTFHVLASMVGREVDWVDLLVFSSLMSKAPRTVERIRNNPDKYVQNPLSQTELIQMAVSADRDRGDKDPFDGLLSEDEDGEATRKLLAFLFPRLARNRSNDYPDCLCLRRPLLTTMRLGLIPNAASREQVEKLFAMPEAQIAAELDAALKEDRFAPLFDRIDDIYSEMPSVDHTKFWSGVMRLLKREDAADLRIVERRSVADNFHSLLRAASKRNAVFKKIGADVFRHLVGEGDNSLVPHWLHYHFFCYGIFNSRDDGEEGAWLSKEETTELAHTLSKRWKAAHLKGALLPKIWDLHGPYAMVQMGQWDSACRAKFTEALGDRQLFDSIALMMFGGIFATGRSAITKLCDLPTFEGTVEERLKADKLSPELRGALLKFKERFFE